MQLTIELLIQEAKLFCESVSKLEIHEQTKPVRDILLFQMPYNGDYSTKELSVLLR